MTTSKSDAAADVGQDTGVVADAGSAAVSAQGSSFSIGLVVDSILKLLSSVRFGLVMLGLLLGCCMLGMLVMQVNVEGFQKYYVALSPAQRAVFGGLGFFEIYSSWYFKLLLGITGLNIILASIDRFPIAWQYVSNPKLSASPKFIRAQMFSAETRYVDRTEDRVQAIKRNWRKAHFKVRVSEGEGRTTIFAQRFVWNRLGAYVVHIALLTIFTGGFLTATRGVGGSMEIEPGKSSDRFTVLRYEVDGPRASSMTLPFKIECVDLKQEIIRPEGGLDAGNTIDWLSTIRILNGETEDKMLVHLNNVGSYRGYRFFQSQFSPVGNAREITVVFEPTAGGEAQSVRLGRQGSSAPQSAEVPGIGVVSYIGFYPDFDISSEGFVTVSGDYNKPVAMLEIQGVDGSRRSALALGRQAAAEFLEKADERSKSGEENKLLYNGHRVLLKEFEKVSRAHTLTIQYDPGRTPVYIGFVLLLLALCGVFFFSHQRVWAVVEPADGQDAGRVYIGGNVNRNRQGFEEVFSKMVRLTEY